MKYSEEVQKLAETLKNSGLSASMTDALERAQKMVGGKEEQKEEVKEVKEEKGPEKGIDASQTTLGDVKGPEDKLIEEATETTEELAKEEVFTNKSGPKKEEPSAKKEVDYSKEKKIDLSDVFDVNKS